MISLSNPWLIAVSLNTILLGIAFLLPKKLLTPLGYLNAWVLGVIIWGTLSWQGYTIVMFYFLVGSAVTKIGIEEKEAAGIAEKRSGARGPENVWGSALVATICALSTLFLTLNSAIFKESWGELSLILQLLLIAYVASFATKLSDTTASEIGKAYGKNTFLITTLKAVPRGTEGAVSWEGTLAGIVASLAISLLAWGLGMINFIGVIICLISAFIATNLESVIGATLQTKFDWLSNEIVNIINTLIGAITAVILALLINQVLP
jgi:uncharacterized protein (TIGR00297 family)